MKNNVNIKSVFKDIWVISTDAELVYKVDGAFGTFNVNVWDKNKNMNDGNDNGCVDDDELVAFSSNLWKATPELCKMDMDSFAIGIDSYASRCISPFIKDFVKGLLRPLTSSKTVKPFGQGHGLNITMIGTLIWKFQSIC